MKRPTLYLDTTIISAFWYDGANIISIGRRLATRQWWETEDGNFDLWASDATEDELEAGWYRRQAEAVAMARRLRFRQTTRQVREFAAQLTGAGVIPTSKPGDALHMAIAAVNQTDYLLTWNYAHLANSTAQARLEDLCRNEGLDCPLLVSPETIPRVSLGQEIRRRRRPR